MDHLAEVSAFKAALTQASDDPVAHDQAVQDTACAMVRTLHKAHWPIEAIIVFAKRTIADSGASPPQHRAVGDPVTEKIVKWCIEHYYAPKD